MRPQLSERTKQKVIRLWLLGFPRDDIASNADVSGGSVNNVVDKWKEDLDKGEADALRELGKSIRASGASPSEYASGARIANLLTKKGVSAEKADQFLSLTYKKCENLGISPNNVVSHIEDLTEFSDEIRLPEIEEYIKQKVREKEELDQQIHRTQERISSLKREADELERRRDNVLEQQVNAGEDFGIFDKAQKELEKLDLQIGDVQKFAGTVKALASCGYRPDWVIAHIGEVFEFNQKRDKLRVGIYEAEKLFNYLNQQNFVLRKQIMFHLKKLPIYRALERYLTRWLSTS